MTPQRTAYTRAEALAAARAWMVATYGRPLDLQEWAKVLWHERYGLLVDFLSEMFPEEEIPEEEAPDHCRRCDCRIDAEWAAAHDGLCLVCCAKETPADDND